MVRKESPTPRPRASPQRSGATSARIALETRSDACAAFFLGACCRAHGGEGDDETAFAEEISYPEVSTADSLPPEAKIAPRAKTDSESPSAPASSVSAIAQSQTRSTAAVVTRESVANVSPDVPPPRKPAGIGEGDRGASMDKATDEPIARNETNYDSPAAAQVVVEHFERLESAEFSLTSSEPADAAGTGRRTSRQMNASAGGAPPTAEPHPNTGGAHFDSTARGGDSTVIVPAVGSSDDVGSVGDVGGKEQLQKQWSEQHVPLHDGDNSDALLHQQIREHERQNSDRQRTAGVDQPDVMKENIEEHNIQQARSRSKELSSVAAFSASTVAPNLPPQNAAALTAPLAPVAPSPPELPPDPLADAEEALQSMKARFKEALKLFANEQILRPKNMLDILLREIDKNLAKTSHLESSAKATELTAGLRQLRAEIDDSPEIKNLVEKYRMLRETFDFFSIDLGTTPLKSSMASGESLANFPSMDSLDVPDSSPRKGGAKKGGGGKRKGRGLIGRSFSGKPRAARGSRAVGRVSRKQSSRDLGSTKGADPDAGWNVDRQKALRVSYRSESNGSVSVKVKGKLRVELFRLLAVVAETPAYHHWVPYLKDASMVAELSKCSRLVQIISDYPWPIRVKESIMYAFGCDALDECGSVIICAKSPPDNATQFMGAAVPPPPKKVQRVPCNHLCFLLQPMDNGSSTMVEIYTNVDPGVNLRLISGILQWLVKRTVRNLYIKISALCENFHGSELEKCTQENPSLYNWISERIADYFSSAEYSAAHAQKHLEESLMTFRLEDHKD